MGRFPDNLLGREDTLANEITRAQLISRLRDPRDLEAWDEFVAVYQPFLLRLTQQWGLQTSDASDVVQDVLLAVATSVHRFEHQGYAGGFRAWLTQIARHKWADYLSQKTKHSLGVGGTDAWEFLHQLPDPHRSRSRWELEMRRELFVWGAAQVQAKVQPANWQAFYLTAVQGLSVEQVAKQLAMPVGLVYVARSRVMAMMRRLISGWLEDHEVFDGVNIIREPK